ncbi:TnsA endonuclease N-terminal domain-containing protein [Desulfosporosinus meridiei]|uniref:TnsA endonuclease N terminal n=1 Tax=Desulfosporosinus meridiei (strain ATCC BAA-275 / DSM 13257 / KCTC 12902 / NCIMB 13706 / S10) TaxID=768704 RepID=J7ITL7_DESMD|nr:TnsA endonuclease N-terminal domain-containing protein [Desulfosporosinus meridiei]AFQ42443.1 TnsA endonuclease N terminal [Desulfosporosinus meridiei DSM 13257]
MPVRKIQNTSSKKHTGIFPSEKNGRLIEWESLLERDYIYLLEFDRGVKSYTEQPLTLKTKLNGKTYKYTPDVLVVRDNISMLIEVKPKNKLIKLKEDEKFRAKVTAANSYCKEQGYKFVIVTDEDIRTGELLNNVKRMFKFSRIVVPSADFLTIRNQLMTYGPMHIKELSQKLYDNERQQKRIQAMVFSLLYSQKLVCDLMKEKISLATYVELP